MLAHSNVIARRRKRRLTVVVFALVAVVLAGGVFAWRNFKPGLSDGEQELVGTWKYRWDGHPNDLPLSYEFRADRTCVVRRFDPETGATSGASEVATWWRTGDKLTVRYPKDRSILTWPVRPVFRHLDDVSILTPDGRDRYRYAGTIETGATPPTPSVMGTMTRVAPSP